MRFKKWISLAVVLTGLVLLMILGVRADPPAQGPELQGAVTGQARAGTSFTYQGQLESGGEPVDDDCDMAFRLYDAESGGSQVGSAISTTVPIVDGLFTVDLDFGGVFTGDARWLALAVRCPAGSGVYEALSPRQSLSPVPYAIHATQAMQATTATIASGVETGAIAPTHLNGIPDNGTSGQVLSSDGGGGFAWQSTAVKQLVQDFVVASGESISAGDVVAFLDGQVYGPRDEWGSESVFNEANTWYIAISALSATDFVVAYADADNANYGTAIVGTVSGGTVSWGKASVFNEAETYPIAVSSLSAASFVVAYVDVDHSGYGMARVGTVSEGTVSWGTASVFNEASTTAYAIAIEALSTTDFVVAYRDGGHSNAGTARVGTVSGGAVSWGSRSEFCYYDAEWIALSALSATEVVVAYQDGTNPNLVGMARVGTVSGVTVTWGYDSPFGGGAGFQFTAVSSLSPTGVVVAYSDAVNSGYGTARVGTVSGGVVSWGPESVFNAVSTTDIAVSALSATEFVVGYRNAARMGKVGSGNTLSWGTRSRFNPGTVSFTAISSLSATEFVVAYQDLDNGPFYGTAIVGNYRGRSIGMAKTAASGGETVTVIISGVSDVHSGLVPGEMYYLQADGSLGLARTDYRAGLAISPTELILDQIW